MPQPVPRIPSQRSADVGGPEGDWPTPTELLPYVPRLVATWLDAAPGLTHRTLHASMLFADISGFTALTERLARLGAVGAEQMSDTLDTTFGELLTAARAEGADLLKWGGDAVILLFEDDGHAVRAARTAHRMRAALRDLVRRRALPVRVDLRMSIGVHSGVFDVFLVGDPASHRELLVTGAASDELVELERVADAGQIAVSAATAALLPAASRGPALEGLTTPGGRLLRSSPPAAPTPHPTPPTPGATGTADASRLTDVSVAIPPQIRDHLLSARGESEHRSVAVAFVEFSGVGRLRAEHGPAVLTDALDEAVRSVQGACLAHDVTFFETDVAQDGIRFLLTAGAPRSAGEDSERLLRTARDVVDGAGVLPVRVGVNRGSVFAGDFGPDFRRTYSVKGDAVNLAARLMARAAPGEVLATEEVVSRSRIQVRTEPIAPFAAKGKKEPVHALRVLGLAEGHAAVATEAPFTGRREELGRLRAAVEGATRGIGSVVDLSGPPGIGKSRLVAELAPLPPAVVLLEADCTDYDSSTSYVAFRTMLRDLLGVRAHDPGELVLERLARRVRDDDPELVPWLPLLSPVLSVELPSTAETRDLDPRFRRHRLEEVTLSLLTSTLPTPTVLVFEDAHLADEASASLLTRLVETAPERPWCVVVTRRDVEADSVPGPGADLAHALTTAGERPGNVRIALGPLPDEAAVDLVEAIAGDASLGLRAVEAMAARGAGNPLFLTSLAAMARRGADGTVLPASVEGVYVHELDRLEPRARSLLRYAAVLGARFDPRFLESLVPRTLAAGAVEELVDFVEPLDDGTVQFRHALMRDVAYDGLPFRLRRSMHAQVAVLLARGGGDDAGPATLSRHFHAAGMHEETWTHSLAAGEDASAAYAYGEAADFFGRALDSAAHLPGLAPETHSTAYVRLGEARDMAGRSVEAISAYRAARRLLPGDPVGQARLMYREARIALRLGRYPQALRMITRALGTLGDRSGPAADAVRAELATRYGFCRHLQGRPDEALRWSTLGARWAEASGDVEVIAHAYNALHLVHGASSVPEDQPYGRLALAAYEGLGDLGGQALCTNNLAIDDYRAGRWTEAATMFERAASIFRRVGDEANEGNVTYNLGDVLVSRGQFEESLPVLRRALRLARGVDDEELVALALREGARAYAALGDTERAWTLFDDARSRFVDLHLPIETALLDAARTEALVDAGRVDEALRLVEESTRRAVAEHLAEALPRLHRVHAFALLAADRTGEALEQAEKGRALVGPDDHGYDAALLALARAEALGLTDPVVPDEMGDLRASARADLERLGVERLAGVPGAAQIPPRTSVRNSTMR